MSAKKNKPYMAYPDGTGGDASPYLPDEEEIAEPGDAPPPTPAGGGAGGGMDAGKYGLGASGGSALMQALTGGGLTGGTSSSPAEFQTKPYVDDSSGPGVAGAAGRAPENPTGTNNDIKMGGEQYDADNPKPYWPENKGSASVSTTPQGKPKTDPAAGAVTKDDLHKIGDATDPNEPGSPSHWDATKATQKRLEKLQDSISGIKGVILAGLVPSAYHGTIAQIGQLRQEKDSEVRMAEYYDYRRGNEPSGAPRIVQGPDGTSMSRQYFKNGRYQDTPAGLSTPEARLQAAQERAAQQKLALQQDAVSKGLTEFPDPEHPGQMIPITHPVTRDMPVQGPQPDVGGSSMPPMSGTSPLTTQEQIPQFQTPAAQAALVKAEQGPPPKYINRKDGTYEVVPGKSPRKIIGPLAGSAPSEKVIPVKDVNAAVTAAEANAKKGTDYMQAEANGDEAAKQAILDRASAPVLKRLGYTTDAQTGRLVPVQSAQPAQQAAPGGGGVPGAKAFIPGHAPTNAPAQPVPETRVAKDPKTGQRWLYGSKTGWKTYYRIGPAPAGAK